jgi:putative transposase
MSTKKNYSAEYKARLALEVLREEQTASEIASREQINVKQLYNWRNDLRDNAALVFDRNKQEREYERKLSEISEREEELMAKVGRLTIENDWIKKKSERN